TPSQQNCRVGPAGDRPCPLRVDVLPRLGHPDRHGRQVGRHDTGHPRSLAAQAELPADPQSGAVGHVRRAQGGGLPGRRRQAQPRAPDRGGPAGRRHIRLGAGRHRALGGGQPDGCNAVQQISTRVETMSASHSVQGKEAPYYYVPADSGHPVRTAVALLAMGLGAAAWVNDVSWGKWLVLVGVLGLIAVLYFWFGDAIQESESGLNSKRIDLSYRWGMSW